MRLWKINCVLLTAEGLLAVLLSAYWDAKLPPNAPIYFLGWSLSRQEGLALLDRIGVCSLVLGFVGYVVAECVVWSRERPRDGSMP